ncbi:MAG: suhB [Amycolatopsis sp.]|jgi:myo-inositol-1(or 4)-monophosphatase|uniref:inositol monophosphatase family protein n=1 Tax=Amycolatopsis sp. TaxID=37632 RepID=UPI0026228364|nr:inositol monophosphatase family protein [Amycolatopsis sp.]MCU1683077.1 suhB [Amycolatopsis sp.]
MASVGANERELKDVAERVAAEAAEVVLEAWQGMQAGREVRVDTKSGETDVVTAVDHESERLIRARLAELRPGDGFIGEEGGGEAAAGGVTWVVDPIDGTVNFLYGLPWFAVSVAAQVDGESVAGAVVEPVSGRRWTAARGEGSWLDGRRLAVSAPERLEVTLVATGFAYNAERRVRQARFAAELLGHVRDIRRPGSGALDLCAVGAGWVDASVEHGLSRWDWAAGALIAAEAGAVVSISGADRALGADATFAAAPSIAGPLRDALIASGAADV